MYSTVVSVITPAEHECYGPFCTFFHLYDQQLFLGSFSYDWIISFSVRNVGVDGVDDDYVIVSLTYNSPPLKTPSALAVHISPRFRKGMLDVKEVVPVNVIVVAVTTNWTSPLLHFSQPEST
jgi:hypothetical protein